MRIGPTIGYTAVGIITAPLWVPATFLGYLGYKGTLYAFRNPKKTAAALALTGLLWYGHKQHAEQDVKELIIRTMGNYDHQRVRTLEETIKTLQQAPRAIQAPSTPPITPPVSAAPPIPPKPTLQSISDPQYNFYYVRLGDTLNSIAKRVSGREADMYTIAQDNEVTDSRKLLAGKLLKIRKELCKNPASVHESIPALRSVVLPGGVRVSEYFGSNAAHVLEINEHLGTKCGDAFPYKRGARYIYY